MSTHADKTQDNRTQSVSNSEHLAQSSSESALQFVDNSPARVAQRKMQEMVNNSLQVIQQESLQEIASEIGFPAQRLEAAGRHEIPDPVGEEPLVRPALRLAW